MDDQVLAAMARWPDVPDVYGWLSLSERGEWRLHPQGDALLPQHCAAGSFSPGEPITSEPILQFINRNYAVDGQGQWYFQNGPQRVYVRLDAAAHIFRTVAGQPTSTGLCSHTEQAVATVHAWYLDDSGRLYAQTDLGPGLVAGRDLPDLLARLSLEDGSDLLDAIESGALGEPKRVTDGRGNSSPLHRCKADDIADILGFVRCPALGRITP